MVGGALTGGMHDNREAVPTGEQPANTMQGSNPCQFEFEQFVQCAQNQHDITFCKGFNEVLKQCKIDHGKYGMRYAYRTHITVLESWVGGSIIRTSLYGQKLSWLRRKYFNKSNNFTVVHNTIWRNVIPPVPGKVSYCDIYF